ncbi:MAG TPA: DUF4139 domain-containing protein [bacterium (Candidatus Stahlbacteria)]|nr:DUF4139 domain-containing protein [Candidatus Stahlbacteria bacterium]
MHRIWIFVFPFLISSSLFGEVELTVYNSNIGLVKDTRKIAFKRGKQEIKFTDVATGIDPTSVSLEVAGVDILEQNYEYDLVNSSKLLQKYIDKNIALFLKNERVEEGKLLSFSPQDITLDTKAGIVIVKRDEIVRMSLPELPEGLVTSPTLVWLVDSKETMEKSCELSYLTQGLNWHAEYICKEKDDSMEFAGWITIDNKSGATYENAKLKIVAGKIHMAKEMRRPIFAKAATAEAAAPVRFEEREFFEYHVYELKGRTTLENNKEKQIRFIAPTDIRTKKIYIYDGARNKNVQVKLEFKNSKEDGLGIPLPMGKVRVLKEDVDGSLEFVGEDNIDHTPKDETVRLYVGDAFDIVGERKMVLSKKITERMRDEDYEIVLKNHKDEDVTIKVIEHLWGDWKIMKASHDYKKKDARTVEFNVKVPKNGKEKITYAVRFTW